MTDEQIILDTINKIKPFIISDGGNIDFVKYENNIVYIKLSGACINCKMIDITMKDNIEFMIKEMVPAVKEVKNVD